MTERPPTRGQGHLGTLLALTVGAVVAGFGVLAPLALWAIPANDLPAPFAEQNQDAETLLFVLTFAVALPLALLVVPRLAGRVARGPGAPALGPFGAAATVALLGLLVLVKLSERLPWGGGIGTLLAVSLAWLLLAGAALVLLGGERETRLPADVARWEPRLWGLAALLGALLVLSFVRLGSISIVPLVVGLVLAGAAAASIGRRSLPKPGRAGGIAVDAAAVVLLLLAVPNVVIFSLGDPALADQTTIIQFHQNFFLGPANQVLGGDPMLIDTLSQYGVGSIYFLAAAFQVIPIGNVSLGVVEGLLSAATFIAAYAVLRIAGASRTIAWAAMTFAVVALVYSLIYPLGGLLQHGAIRFGLPAGVIVAAVIASRWPRRAGPAWALGLATVGLSSIWALEAFAYTVLTLAGVLAYATWDRPAGERRAWILRRAAEAAGACVVAHLAFAAATLAAAGELPDWGMYLSTLRAFLVGGIGELTYDFLPWTPALAVGGLYVASAAAIVLIRRAHPARAEEWRTILVALSGSTAWGIALFSYFVNRSADHILPYISLPAVMVGALWVTFALRPDTPTSAVMRRAAVGVAAGLAVLVVAVAWTSLGTRASQSALAHVVPGGDSLGDAFDVLRDPPELSPGAASGEQLLEEHMPGEEESIVLTSADLGVEVLMRTQRINRIPLADPWEESLVPGEHLPALEEAVEELDGGDRLLLDGPALKVFRGYERQPGRDPLVSPFSQATLVPTGIAVLQEYVLDEISERFSLGLVARGEDGLFVAELVPREGSGD